MTENDERRLAGYRDFLSIDHGVTAPDVAFFMRLLDEATAALAQRDERIRRLEAVLREIAAIDPLSGGGEVKYFVTGDLIVRARAALDAANGERGE